jgi:hypothetical protein
VNRASTRALCRNPSHLFFPSNLVCLCWTAVEPCLCLTLLFPEHTEILDGLAMVGITHTHNLFDVLGVSQEPLVQAFFSFPFTRSRSLCCPMAPSSLCAAEVRRYRAKTAEPAVARSSCRFLQGPRHHDPQNPWSCTFAHKGHAFDPGNLVSLPSVRRRVSFSPVNPFRTYLRVVVLMLAVCCEPAIVPWCPLFKKTRRCRNRTSPPASFAAPSFL